MGYQLLPHGIAPIFRLASLLVLTLLLGRAVGDERPNIILIIGDDHGWPHSGFMGDPVAVTPNLDGLAAGGTVFTNVHSPASLCRPSLQTLLSGLHPTQWSAKRGAVQQELGPMPHRAEVAHYRTLPRELQRVGYASFEGGKMWESTYGDAGFTHGLADSVDGFFETGGGDFGRVGIDPLRSFFAEVGDEPFFVWFAPMLPHRPFDAAQKFREPFELLGLELVAVNYYANLMWLDAVIGELLTTLDTEGLRENTLVIYVSDNGWEIGQFGAGDGHGKGSMYELGFRTPLVFNLAGRVPAGVVRDDLVSAEDVVPTVLDYAGARPFPDRAGASLRASVETGAPFGRDRVVSYQRFRDGGTSGYFVRTPQWRYIAFDDGHEELYEIAVDPFEEDDLAGLHPSMLDAFRAEVTEWRVNISTAPDALDVTGVVHDVAGAPIVGVSVRLRGRTHDDVRIKLRVLTGPGGGYRFEHLPRGTYHLRAGARVARLALPPFSVKIPAPLPVAAAGNHRPLQGEARRQLGVVNDSSVSGTVFTDIGGRVGGARVAVRGHAQGSHFRVKVRTDADGRYRADNLPPGSYRIRARASGAFGRAKAAVEVPSGADLVRDLVLPAR